MQKLSFFLFGFITALFLGILAVDKYVDNMLDEYVLELFYTTYWQYYYYVKIAIVTLFIFSVLTFVFSLGNNRKKHGYEEIGPE